MATTLDTPRRRGRPLSFDRDAALEKAMLAFWRHGYESTSISILAAAMGVTAPSIYAAFGDKRQLFLEAMHRYAGSLDSLSQALTAAPTAREAAHRMLLGAAERFTGKGTPHGCLMASATAGGSADSAVVRRAVADVRRKIETLLRRRIEADVSSGELSGATNAAVLAGMVIALIQGLSLLARDGAKRETLNAIVEAGLGAWPRSARMALMAKGSEASA